MSHRVLFACGGTAGHINPALAVAQKLSSENIECIFVGNRTGMEKRLVENAGFKFYEFRAMGIQRKINLENILKNIKSIALLATAKHRAKALLRSLEPSAVVGTGGYVSAPILHTAALLKIPTLIHEQNALPGVTNKLLAPRVDTVLVAVEKAADRLKAKKKIIVTGNPVRKELFSETRATARKQLKIPDNKLCILSFGGSLGADCINKAAAELMVHFKDEFHYIHAVGRDTENFLTELANNGLSKESVAQLDIRKYIDNMPTCLLAADIVICRAGAMTLSELTAIGRASILIPSPNVAENHQYHNAKVLSDAGAAMLIEESGLSGKKLIDLVNTLTKDTSTRYKMEQNAKKLGIKNATEQIAEQIKLFLK